MNEIDARQVLIDMADLLRPAAIRAAATLRIAEHVAAGASCAADVARKAGTSLEVTEIFLRYLADLGLLRQAGGGRYELGELGKPLLEGGPGSVAGILRSDSLAGRGELAMVGVLHTIRTGEPSYPSAFGRGYWEDVNNDPTLLNSFEENTVDVLAWDMQLVVDSYDWSKVRWVVDVGGHTGTLLAALARRYPHLRGTLIDLKNAVEVARRRFAAAGLAERCDAVVGNFFEPLVPGGDVYLLSAILADWTDEQAVTILRRCAEAAGPQGRVLLAEVTLPAQDARTQLWLRAYMPAPARTVEQLKALGRAAGLTVTWEGPVTPLRSLIEFSPAGADG